MVTSIALTAFAGTTFIATAHTAAAASTCFTDPSGDTVSAQTQAQLNEPRSDITTICGQNDGTTVTLTLRNVQPVAPGPEWGGTIQWKIHVDPVSPTIAEYSAVHTARGASVEQAFQGQVCLATTSFDGTTYSLSFPSSCIDDRASFNLSASLSYDVNGDGNSNTGDGVDFTQIGGPVTVRPTSDPAPAAEVLRLSGGDRIATAIAISRDDWADRQARTVVLARQDAFPDALAGTPLAVRMNGPLLLTPSTALPASVADEIRRVYPGGGTVYLLGGTAAISQAVEDEVKRLVGTVVRLAGADRYATAVSINRRLGTPTRIFEATGLSFQNALISGVAASGTGGVVVLTADGQMPAATKAYLDSLPSVERVAVGPQAGTADPGATKVSGANVYDTARLLAQRYLPSPLSVGVASGTVFADALGGGAHVGRTGGPLLLSEPSSLPPEIAAYLSANKASIDTATLYGGPAALTTSVEDSIRTNTRR